MKKGFTPLEITRYAREVNNRTGITKRLSSQNFSGLRLPKGRLSLTGFTLIELMLVVMIIGVLAGLVVPRLAGRAEKAKRVAAKSEIESSIPSALNSYEVDMGDFPQKLDDLMQNPSGSSNWDGPYLNKLPKDPWGKPYYYKAPGEHNTDFDLASSGKDGVLGNDDDVKNWE